LCKGLKQRNHEAALQLFEQAIAKDPRLAEAHERYAMSLFALKRFREGAAVARRGLARLPDDPGIRAALGMNLFRLGRRKEAHAHLGPAAKALPTRFEIQAATAACCLEVEDYPCAARALKNFLKHRPAKLARADFQFKAQLGKALVRDGQLEQADRVLQQVLRRHPDHVTARLAMGELYLRRAECAKAVAVFERLVREPAGGQEAQRGLERARQCAGRGGDADADAR
jgi:tetratricopeptide (TPR) repeat protein